MRYATATAFRRALETRLLEHSRNTSLPLVRLRRTVAFERVLARLCQAAPERWLLKGGLALDYRLGARARTTKDMDLARYDGESAATADLLAAQRLDLGDFFVIRGERTATLDAALEGAAVRYRVRVELASRPFETVTLDVGFAPQSSFHPETLTTSHLLSFAGIASFAVPALPLPQHVAEKVHAYTRTYGEAASASTRVKDLVDLVLIASSEAIAAGALRRALEETFTTRATHTLPPHLPPPPLLWDIPYRKLATEVGLDPNLTSGHLAASRFLDPILAHDTTGGLWDPTSQTWSTSTT